MVKMSLCEDCISCAKIKGVECCVEMFNKPFSEFDECPFDYTEEEQKSLNKKAKENKVKIYAQAEDKPKTGRKPVTKKVSDTKKEVFSLLYESLFKEYGADIQIINENKLLFLKTNGKMYKIDLIETKKDLT